MVSLSFFFTVKINDICFIIILMCFSRGQGLSCKWLPQGLATSCKGLQVQTLNETTLEVQFTVYKESGLEVEHHP